MMKLYSRSDEIPSNMMFWCTEMHSKCTVAAEHIVCLEVESWEWLVWKIGHAVEMGLIELCLVVDDRNEFRISSRDSSNERYW